jgi:hypothetical protein
MDVGWLVCFPAVEMEAVGAEAKDGWHGVGVAVWGACGAGCEAVEAVGLWGAARGRWERGGI